MKKALALAAIAALVLSSCATILGGILGEMFPAVDEPKNPDSSMIVIELIAYTDGEEGTIDSRNYNNLPNSGFYPVVEGPDGTELSFESLDSSTRSGFIYWASNVQSGNYTLTGFRYLWMTHDDYMNTPIKDLQFEGQNDAAWQKKSFYPLAEEITEEIQAGTVASMGRYKVYYTLKEEGQERFNIESWEYSGIDPNSTNALADMKNWRSGNWPAWNQRNPVPAKE